MTKYAFITAVGFYIQQYEAIDNISNLHIRKNLDFFNNNCRLRWKSFTLSCRIISSGIRLYTHIRPSALLRSISRNRLFLMSANCLPCLTLELRVLLLCLDDAVTKEPKCSGPFFQNTTVDESKHGDIASA